MFFVANHLSVVHNCCGNASAWQLHFRCDATARNVWELCNMLSCYCDMTATKPVNQPITS